MKAASILANCIKEDRLADYDKLWKKELLSEIKIGLKVKDVYSRFNEEELKKIFKLLKAQKALIEKVADFENHSKIVVELIKNPRFYSSMGQIFQIFFKKLFY